MKEDLDFAILKDGFDFHIRIKEKDIDKLVKYFEFKKHLGAIGAFRVCLEAIKQADERHGDKRISFGEVKGEIEIRLSEEKEGIFTLGEEEGRVLRELNH